MIDHKSANYRVFRENIRSYNSAFACATFRVNQCPLKITRKGPYLLKILGQVYHIATTNLYNDDNINPRNGQIYIYDPHEAVNYRSGTQNTLPEILEKIENLLHKVYPYAKLYKILNDKYIESGDDELTLNFVKYKYDDMRRYNLPVSGEVAAVIVSKDGAIPHDVDLCVYPKNDRYHKIMNKNSPHVDSLCFPILFPKGDLGWTYSSTCEGSKHITALQYYSHRLSYREEVFSPVLYAGRFNTTVYNSCIYNH